MCRSWECNACALKSFVVVPFLSASRNACHGWVVLEHQQDVVRHSSISISRAFVHFIWHFLLLSTLLHKQKHCFTDASSNVMLMPKFAEQIWLSTPNIAQFMVFPSNHRRLVQSLWKKSLGVFSYAKLFSPSNFAAEHDSIWGNKTLHIRNERSRETICRCQHLTFSSLQCVFQLEESAGFSHLQLYQVSGQLWAGNLHAAHFKVLMNILFEAWCCHSVPSLVICLAPTSIRN